MNDARIDTTRRLLENTDLPLKQVAARSGIPTSEALRRLFLRRLEIGPGRGGASSLGHLLG